MSTYVTNLEFENAWGRISNKLPLIEFDSARAANSFQNPVIEEAISMTPSQYEMKYEKLASILYGQNGSGKTTSMRMLSGLTELVRGLLKQYNNHDNYSDMNKLYENLIKHGTLPENLVSSEDPTLLTGVDMSNNEIISNIQIRERDSKNEFNLELSGFHQCIDIDGFEYKFKIKLQRSEFLAHNYLHPALVEQYNNFNGDFIYFFHLELERLNDKLEFVDEGEIMEPTLKPLTEGEIGWDEYYSNKNILPFIITDDRKVISLPPYYSNWFNNYEDWGDEGIDWERLSKREEFLEQIEYHKVGLDDRRGIVSTEMHFDEFLTNMFPLIPNEKFHADLLDEYEFWHLGEDTTPFMGDLIKMSDYFQPFNEIIEGISSDITNISDLEIRIEPINDIGKSTNRIDIIDFVKELGVLMGIVLAKNELHYLSDDGMIPAVRKWEEYDDEDKRRFHIAALFKAFFNLANTESFSRKNDPDWIKENSEELCKIFLHWTEFFLLRIYEKGTHRNKAKRSIGQEFGYGVSFNKELMEYSLEDMNYFEILDLCRSRIELIKSYLIPNYFIHTKNEFTRKIIERFTGINIEKIHIKKGRPKLSLDGLSVKFEDLSSGQKRIIQLITALLSNEVNGPIMIDEPEISLHPIWLTELKEIITSCMKYSKRQVIICTHSPELVYLFEDAIPVEHFSKIEE
jgi:energy-coupling factor transporter ATP-binding protein EcfA2